MLTIKYGLLLLKQTKNMTTVIMYNDSVPTLRSWYIFHKPLVCLYPYDYRPAANVFTNKPYINLQPKSQLVQPVSPNISAGSQSSNCHLLDKKYHTIREPSDGVRCQLILSGTPSRTEPFVVVGTRDHDDTGDESSPH